MKGNLQSIIQKKRKALKPWVVRYKTFVITLQHLLKKKQYPLHSLYCHTKNHKHKIQIKNLKHILNQKPKPQKSQNLPLYSTKPSGTN